MGMINNANTIIGDNMRYLQQLQANPQAQQTSTTSNNNANSELQMLMPMLMMMLSQMMGQTSSQTGQSPYQTSIDPFMGLPNSLPLPPYQNPPPTPSGPPQWIQQNPAYQYLNTQLGLNGTTTTTGSTVAPPDFSDNGSLAARMNALLASSPDTNLHTLGNQLLVETNNGADPSTSKAQVQIELGQQGRSSQDVEEFGILYDAMQNNQKLDQDELQAATNPSIANSQNIAQLNQEQDQLANNWNDLHPNNATTGTTTATNTQTLTQNIQQALANGQFTPVQLGQSLKYLLHNAPASAVGDISNLTSSLMKSGNLNIIPFLHHDYLDQLPPERQETLLNAVENAGLTLSNGQPNSRFAGFLLERLSSPGTSSTQNFLQQFLQKEWQANGQSTTTPEGQALNNVLQLAGIQGTAGQPLNLV